MNFAGDRLKTKKRKCFFKQDVIELVHREREVFSLSCNMKTRAIT